MYSFPDHGYFSSNGIWIQILKLNGIDLCVYRFLEMCLGVSIVYCKSGKKCVCVISAFFASHTISTYFQSPKNPYV